MKKLLLISLLGLSSLLAEETYVFKAKGEFAKELKALMEKHAKDGKVEIQKVEENDQSFTKKSKGIIASFLNNEERPGDIARGKQIYETTCFKCHGMKAEKSTYPNARNLNTLTKEQLVTQIDGYSRDETFGGSTKMIMNQYAVSLTTSDIASVSAYIYSLTHKLPETTQINSQSDEVPVTTSEGSYLK